MRILYFADIRFPLERANGIQTMETCYALASRGHEVRLVVRPDSRRPSRDPFDYYGLRCDRRLIVERAPVSGPQMLRRIGYLSFAAGRALGAGRGGVILTRDLGTAATVLRIPGSLRPPLVYESHGYAPEVASALPEMLTAAPAPGRARLDRLTKREEVVWRSAEGYVTITRGLARVLEEKLGPRPRVAVIPDGVRLDGGRRWDSLPVGDPVIVGYAGHLYPWKGVDVLLEAVARVPRVKALIAGGHQEEGDRARLESRTAALKIADRVTFTGHVPPSQVPDILARAAILALPNPASALSTRSTSPLKLFEYMAAGRAIVASDLPAIREILRHESNALLVRAGDPAALAAAIERLAADRDLAARIARQAFEDVADYGWDRRAQRLEDLFEDVRAAG